MQLAVLFFFFLEVHSWNKRMHSCFLLCCVVLSDGLSLLLCLLLCSFADCDSAAIVLVDKELVTIPVSAEENPTKDLFRVAACLQLSVWLRAAAAAADCLSLNACVCFF